MDRPKIVVAIDSFKGCLTSQEANMAAAEGIWRTYPDAEVVQVPVSDGGEGFLEAFHAALGGRFVEVTVNDPLMRPIVARYLLCGDTAVIEIAQASGLTLLKTEERNPLKTTSYGTGELVVDAIRKGAKHIVVGLGGSATSDAGMGMLEAMQNVECIARLEETLSERSGERTHNDIHFTIATDVQNPLCGEHGAAHVFAPQKGASAADVLVLDERAKRFAEESAKLFGYDRSEMPGAGAAGGLGYAFMQYLNATCQSGVQLLLDTIGFKNIVEDADWVVTGEGAADHQTLMGKLPMGILQQSGRVPVCLIAGRISDCEELLNAGFARVECINPSDIALQEAMRKEVAKEHIRRTMAKMLKE